MGTFGFPSQFFYGSNKQTSTFCCSGQQIWLAASRRSPLATNKTSFKLSAIIKTTIIALLAKNMGY
jgi:hypothetical protein